MHVSSDSHLLLARCDVEANDLVVLTPASCATCFVAFSEAQFELKVSPENYGKRLAWWPELNWGTFCLCVFLAKTLVTSLPSGLSAHLNFLPTGVNDNFEAYAQKVQQNPLYRNCVGPIAASCRISNDQFDHALRRAATIIRCHAVPIWSEDSGGHPWFAETSWAKGGKGDVVALVPMVDLAAHASDPNCVIGHPDTAALSILATQCKLPCGPDAHYFALQATRPIKKGDRFTVNKNVPYGFDEKTFISWFGYPFK